MTYYLLSKKAILLGIVFLMTVGVLNVKAKNVDPEIQTEQTPNEACTWTVTVGSIYFGDEVYWELRGSDGAVLLSGGPYEDGSYHDVQTVSASGPLEFFISANGPNGDNYPSYYVENENGIIVSGVILDGGTATHSNLNCEDMPASTAMYTCVDNEVSLSDEGIQSALDFGFAEMAIDLIAGDNPFTAHGVEIVAGLGDGAEGFTYTLYNDESGAPGQVLQSGDLSIVNSEFIEFAFDVNMYKYRLKFSEEFEVPANTTYWLQISTPAGAWVASWDIFGSSFMYRNEYTNNEWVKDYDDLVFTLICEDMGSDDLNSDYRFSYHPNPVKDVLNIQSDKAVKSFEIYNLAGQKVMHGSKLTNSQLDFSNMVIGTYVVKLTMEGGQIETFKIVKK